MNRARRPYVICHMVPSVDGRIVTTGWKLPPGVLAEYERTALRDVDAVIVVIEEARERLVSLGVSAEKMQIVPPSIDLRLWTPPPRRGILRDRSRSIRQAQMEVEFDR